MSTPDTPLFVKTHDFLLWLIRHTQRFPKNLRQSYTLKLEWMALDFQEAILMANAVRGSARSIRLEKADGKLVCLRKPPKPPPGALVVPAGQPLNLLEQVDPKHELGRPELLRTRPDSRQTPR
jgi:hypothetical protein